MSASRRRALAAIALVALVATPLHAQDPRASSAQRAAREWLAYTDALDAPASWQRAGKKFQNAVAVDKWTEALTQERGPRGKTEQRTVLSTEFPRQIPGFDEGDYALVIFRTAFEKRIESEESLTLEREPDGVWRVVGYYIR